MAQNMFAIMLCMTAVAMVAESKQWYGVQGTLMCGNKPYANARVWLYDIDIGMAAWLNSVPETIQPGFDDTMAKNCTDARGNFWLGGYASDTVGTIDSTLKIYHSCNPDTLQVRTHVGLKWVCWLYSQFEMGLLNFDLIDITIFKHCF